MQNRGYRKRGGNNNRGRYRGRRNPAPRAVSQIDPFAGDKFIRQPAPNTLPEDSVSVYWFRNDLRVRDNPALALATTSQVMVPVYVYDTRRYGPSNLSPYGFERTGPFRAAFQRETVSDLTNSLRLRGSDILIRQGEPVEEILEIVRELGENDFQKVRVVVRKEIAWEEVQDEQKLQKALKEMRDNDGLDVDIHFIWGGTLTHIDDLPFNGGGPWYPSTFTEYRKMIEKNRETKVRKETAIPSRLSVFPMHLNMRCDPPPSLEDDLEVSGLCTPNDYPYPHPLAAVDFVGGESLAHERWKEWAWSCDSLKEYKETRNESGKRDCSSKISPWLALGCISPVTLYWDVKKYEDKVEKNDSTYWFIFELMTRDYFMWVTASVGSKLFARSGYTGNSKGWKEWEPDPLASTAENGERLLKWIEGQTGAPFVDASMRELKQTGYMSNRGRQNVASFLIHDLKFPDWRAGAEYFESVLIDHEPAANWGNWAYIAGVGSDPRGGRRFNVVKQGIQYDPDAFFVTRWCPELLMIPPPMIHEPHTLTELELEDLEVKLGETYPLPIVPLLRAPGGR